MKGSVFSSRGSNLALSHRLDELCHQLGVQYHGVRFRTTGNRVLVEVHLLFPHDTAVGDAHSIATQIEERLSEGLDIPAEVITHLESLEDHARVHRVEHYTGRPR